MTADTEEHNQCIIHNVTRTIKATKFKTTHNRTIHRAGWNICFFVVYYEYMGWDQEEYHIEMTIGRSWVWLPTPSKLFTMLTLCICHQAVVLLRLESWGLIKRHTTRRRGPAAPVRLAESHRNNDHCRHYAYAIRALETHNFLFSSFSCITASAFYGKPSALHADCTHKKLNK